MKADELSAILEIVVEEFAVLNDIEKARSLLSWAMATGKADAVIGEIRNKALDMRNRIITKIRGLK